MLLRPKLPSLTGRTDTAALSETGSSELGRAISDRLSEHDGLTGVHLLRDGRNAFAARAVLARAAGCSLDVQYYIWHDDLSGSLMLDELRAAADRGVRVRLLLDDNGVGGLDDTLAALNTHPLVEVRLFNPFVIRRPKSLNWLLDFQRLNRRMHAKSFTADNLATIVGGRNVGDEYFGAREDDLFADLDALCLGKVVAEVSAEFDRHWNSQSAYPAERLLTPVGPARVEALRRKAERVAGGEEADAYRAAIRALPLFNQLVEGELAFEWAPVRLMSDDPEKALGRARTKASVSGKLADLLEEPDEELLLVSGYFVPTEDGTDDLIDLARQGVRVRVLTNSYAANDVGLVHAGYAPRRRRLLEGGVELFEMPAPDDKPKSAAKFLRPGSRRGRQMPGSTLHAKMFAVDRERLFVGSFNLDPRSAHLNTELGIVIDSPALAAEMSRSFEEEIVPNSYRLCLDDGQVAWIDERDDEPHREHTEPGTSWGSRLFIRLLARLPIEWLL